MSKSPSLRRIQADIRELALDPSDRYYAHPLEHDMFEWHFTIRGADDTDFEGGIYHGRVLVSAMDVLFNGGDVIYHDYLKGQGGIKLRAACGFIVVTCSPTISAAGLCHALVVLGCDTLSDRIAEFNS